MALAYPTPIEHLYMLLRGMPVADLRRQFTRWRFSGREQRTLIDLQPLARQNTLRKFQRDVLVAVRRTPADFPYVVRPRPPAPDRGKRIREYRALLKGKRVVLVGPSQSIAGTRQGRAIEDHDLVVRINFQWPIPRRLAVDIGQRMDVLYHCCNGDVPITRLFRPGFDRTRFVCWQLGVDSDALHDHCVETGVPDVEVSPVFERLLAKMHAFPTTGTVALYDLLSHDIRSLYVTGMTFFRDAHYAGYPTGGRDSGRTHRRGRSPVVGIHDVGAQFALVRRLHATDSRLSVDSTLAALLEQHA